MKKRLNPHFLVIDDDPVNNQICRQAVKVVLPQAEVRTFEHALNGLMYLLTLAEVDENDIILLLDINMPGLSGWDVMSRLQDISGKVKKQLIIYILSSSVAAEDKQIAESNELIAGFIEKPFTTTILRSIVQQTRYK